MRGVTLTATSSSNGKGISTRTPHAGSDAGARIRGQPGRISTRTPHAGSDGHAAHGVLVGLISTRTPHAGSDSSSHRGLAARIYFNPHSPCGE